MEDEDLGGYGRPPEDWYFASEREAVAFYKGDAIAAMMMEASPESQTELFSSVCGLVSRFERLVDAFGLMPNLPGARNVASVTTTDVAVVLEIPHSIVQAWDSGQTPLPAGMAVEICKAFRWPLAMLYRTRTAWHRQTEFGIQGGDSEDLPF